MRVRVKRFLWVCWYRVWTVVAVSIILTALIFSVARLLIPIVPSYKQEIERFASEIIQRQVDIGEITTDWKWFRPRVKLLNVDIFSEKNDAPLLQVEQVVLSINIFSSLFNWNAEIDDIALLGTEVAVKRDTEGQIYLQNIMLYSGGKTVNEVGEIHLPPALENKTLRLYDVDVHYSDEDLGFEHQFDSLNVSLRLTPKALAAYIDVGLPLEYGQRLELGMELDGGLDKPQDLQGVMFARIVDMDLAKFSERFGYQDYLRNGSATLDVWLNLKGQRQYKLLSHVVIENPTIAAQQGSDANTWSTDQVAFNAYVETDVNQIKIGLFDLALKKINENLEGQDQKFLGLSNINFITEREKDSRYKKGKLTISGLNIEDFSPLLDLAPAIYNKLNEYSVKGVWGAVEDVYVDWDLQESESQWQLDGAFKNISLQGINKMPSLHGFGGRIHLQNKSADIQLETPALVLDYPNLFRKPLPAMKIIGNLKLLHDEQGFIVSSRDLSIETEHARSRHWFDLKLPIAADPWLDAYALCSASDASATPLYLPAGKLSPKALEWLDQAFVSGVAENGEFEFSGQLNQYPFRGGEGLFRIEFDTIGNEVSFWPPGPNARNVRAHVKFLGPSLSIFVHDLEVLQSIVHDVELQVDDMKSSRMEVHAYGYGSAEDALNYIKKSKLREKLEPVISQVSMQGNQAIELSMSLPMHKDQELVDFSVNGSLYQGELNFNEWRIFLTEFNPKFHLTESLVEVEEVASKFNGQAVLLSADTVTEDGIRVVTNRLKGEVGIGDLAKHWNFPIAKYLQGQSSLQAKLRLALNKTEQQQFNPQLNVIGDLKGTELSMPYPLNKLATKKAKLIVDSYFNTDEIDVYMNYADKLQSALRFDSKAGSQNLSRADFRFYINMPKMPKEDGIWVSGIIPTLNLDGWQALSMVGQGSDGYSDKLREVDLNVKEIIYLRRKIKNLRLRLDQQPNNWRFLLDSKILSGQILMPKKGFARRGLALNFDHIDLDAINKGFAGEGPRPSELPPFQFSAKKILLNQWDLRDVNILAAPAGEKLIIHNMRIKDSAVGMQGSGEWSLSNKGQHHTAFKLIFNSENIGLGMTRFGFVEILKGGKGTAAINVEWDDAPANFSLDLLQGDVNLALKKGQILDIDPGGGRILGLLSLQTIPRRLALDFNDLFSKGYRFDKMNGNFTFKEGNAFTKDYYIDGPSGRIDITGRIGLVKRDYYQQIQFRPDLSSSLPILGAILGGSTGGWAVILADRVARLFGKEADDLAQIRYTLTGSWDEPIFTPIKKKSATAANSQKMKKVKNGKK